MKKMLDVSVLFFLIITLFAGCKKEGPPGPAGPPGHVNIYSHTYSVSSWANDGYRWYYNFSVSELTSTNIDSASVQVYAQTIGGGNWVAVPYTYVSSTDYFMGFSTGVNNVKVTWTYNGIGLGNDPNSEYGYNVGIKIVVIPPSGRKANPDLNLTDYEAVKARFHLSE